MAPRKKKGGEAEANKSSATAAAADTAAAKGGRGGSRATNTRAAGRKRSAAEALENDESSVVDNEEEVVEGDGEKIPDEDDSNDDNDKKPTAKGTGKGSEKTTKQRQTTVTTSNKRQRITKHQSNLKPITEEEEEDGEGEGEEEVLAENNRGNQTGGSARQNNSNSHHDNNNENENNDAVEEAAYACNITFEEGWNQIIRPQAIDRLSAMLNGGLKGKRNLFGPHEYIDVYTVCYDMCTQHGSLNHCKKLYEAHGEAIEEYLTRTVLPSLREKKGQGGHVLLLQELQLRWSNHQIMNKWLAKFLVYLDRYYVKHHSLPPLKRAGLDGFKRHCYGEIRSEATDAVLYLIQQERDDAVIDKSLVKSTVELYQKMGMGSTTVYEDDFEKPFLVATREYYSQKRVEWIDSVAVPDYLVKAEKAYEHERQRVSEYLVSSTETKLLKVLDEELLAKAEAELLEKEGSGCRVLLQNDKHDDLHRMFRLFQRITEGLDPIARIMQQFVTSKGDEVIQARKARTEDGIKEKGDDPKFVKDLMDLHEKYLNMVRSDFGGHVLFQKALKNALGSTINREVGQFTTAELISTYADRVLKSGGEKATDNTVEEDLEKLVQLFSYLIEKDLFAEIYRNQMAKRLLGHRSSSEDSEKLMIAKLKIQCGTQFTSKMEGMLADLAISVEQKALFAKHLEKKGKGGCCKLDFSVQVLTVGFWPTHQSPEVTLTEEMSNSIKIFEQWHDNQHSKRKLKWVTTQGNASVRGTFGKKTYDFQLTTLQALALDALSGGHVLSFKDLSEKLNLQANILKPLMHSLACGKFKVISKSPASNKINETDTFTANTKFHSNSRKIRIAMASLESSFNKKKVEEDRSFSVDSAIVRIMKARKTLGHQDLVSEVLSQLSLFQPSPRLVKKRIETLIEREYLERNESDTSKYNYLA